MSRIFLPANEFYPTEIGGVARSILELTKLNHEVLVFTGLKGISKPEVWSNRVKIFNNATVIYSASEKLVLKDIPILIKLIRDVDLCYCNSLFSKYSLVTIIVAWLLRKPVLLSPRGELFDSAISTKRRVAKKCLIALVSRIIKEGLVSSEAEKITFKNYFPSASVRVIANPVYTPDVKMDVKFRKKIVFLGRIAPIKNLDRVLGFNFASVGWNLDVFGPVEGQHKEYYESLNFIAEFGINYKGVLNDNEKWDILSSCGFLVLPSLSENFGNVVVEAMSQGIPVIISKGVPFDVTLNGIISLDSMNFDLLNFLDSITQDEWLAMSDSVYQYYRDNFNSDVLLQKVSDVIYEIIH